MKKLIYSKRFPSLDEPEVSEDLLVSEFANILEQTKDEFTVVHLPERTAMGEEFIERAKAIADKYEYDVEIYSDLNEIEVCMAFDHQLTYSDFPHFIGMADDISIHANMDGREFEIWLTYYKCEIYRNGKKILPNPEAD